MPASNTKTLVSTQWLNDRINDPKAIGPAVALAFLSLLYALFLLCMGRIWFPSETLDSEQNIKTGFLSLAFPVLTWSMIIFGVMMMSFM